MEMQKDLKKTPLSAWHKEHGGQMVEFAGWEMPVAYEKWILEEHLFRKVEKREAEEGGEK
jgi:aminomethyltransferase